MNVAAILKVKSRNVVTTTADKSLLDVAKLIDRHDIGCIVIEGDDGQIAGVVSERDLVCAIGIASMPSRRGPFVCAGLTLPAA